MRLQNNNQNIDFEIQNNQIEFLNDKKIDFKISNRNSNSADINVNGKKYNTNFFKFKDTIFVNLDGRNYIFKHIEDDDIYEQAANNLSEAEIKPPMPGSVVKLLVSKGDEVKEGDGLIVVEAMKMETTLFSPIDGKVAEINVTEKDQLSGEETLLVIEK